MYLAQSWENVNTRWKELYLLEEGRDAHNITANAATRLSFESALEEERRIKIFRLWDHHNTFKAWHCKIANIEYNFDD